MDVPGRLRALRGLMKKEGIDAFIVTKYDPHQSEYSPDFWNGVRFISGFTGSAGLVVVTESQAGLWTDGRYSIAAGRELKGSGVGLHQAAEPGVKDYLTFARDETPDGGTIGFDGRTMSVEHVRKLQALCRHKKIRLKTDKDLLGEIWEDRPPLSNAPVYDFGVSFCGAPRLEKIGALRERMRESGADVYVLSSTDDIAWLFNLRGADVANSTCFASFAVIDHSAAAVFIHGEKGEGVRALLAEDGVELKDYSGISGHFQKYETGAGGGVNVLLNPQTTSYAVYKAILDIKGCEITTVTPDYTTEMKAVKNGVEFQNLEETNLKDGAVMVRFIKWIKENAGAGGVTEYDVSAKLLELRSMEEGFVCPSFETIPAYMSNAAMMHYSAKKDGCAAIRAEGMLLVDSGGHYLGGTTDITRTIVLGAVTGRMKADFTLVLKSHIALARTVFLYGSTGSNLDVIARLPMWENGLDYKCGTGHGVGFCLNVHEGPQSIRPAPNAVKLEPGMILTNEPGVYRENEYGIRTENTMKVVEHSETAFGRFLAFELFSYCPIDLAGVKADMLTEEERGWLNAYHETVYEKLAPRLSTDEKTWLRRETREI